MKQNIVRVAKTVGFLMCLAAPLVGASSVYAAGSNEHTTPQGPESNLVYEVCGPNAWPWFSAPGSSFYSVPTDSNPILFNPDNPIVNVVWRGSFCTYGSTNSSKWQIWSSRLECNLHRNGNCADTDGVKKSGVFDTLNGKQSGAVPDYYRGVTTSNGKSTWTRYFYNSAPSELTGKIDLTKVPGFNKNATGVQTLNVPIISTMKYSKNDGSKQSGSGYWWSLRLKVKAQISWTTTGTTTVNRTTAKPGDTVTWTHRLKNNGPSAISNIRSQTVNTGFNDDTFNRTKNIVTEALGSGSTRKLEDKATYAVKQADVGNKLCQQLQWDPTNSSGGRDGRAPKDPLCINVPYSWKLTPETQLTSATSSNNAPGQELKFEHKLTNNGPTKTNKAVTYQTKIVRIKKSSTPTEDDIKTAATSGTVLKQKTDYSTITADNTSNENGSARTLRNWFSGSYTSYTLTQDDVDSYICGYIVANPKSTTDSDWVRGWTCKYVPYNYNLTTDMKDNVPTIIEPGGEIPDIGGSINNGGPTKSKPETHWELTTFVVGPTGSQVALTKSGASALSTVPCNFYVPHVASPACSTLDSGDGSIATSGLVVNSVNSYVVPDNLPVGAKVCFALSVRDRANNKAEWYHSVPVCVVAGKKPKVQIQGGDLIAGRTTSGIGAGLVQTSTSQVRVNGTARTYGSWVEYGAFATRTIRGMASASAYNNGPEGHHALCAYSSLSFSNIPTGSSTCNDTTVGLYTFATNTPNIAASFPSSGPATAPSGGRFDVGASVAGTYTFTSDVAIGGSELTTGKSIIIRAPGRTVTIDGNITYQDGPYSNGGQIPQLVIIAQNVNITNDVTRLDAWLIVSNNLNTCSRDGLTDIAVSARLSSKLCANTLLVNGPVTVGKKLYLRRTAGAEAGEQSGDPAETFNLRADAYLWAYTRAQDKTVPQTAYQQELPVRF